MTRTADANGRVSPMLPPFDCCRRDLSSLIQSTNRALTWRKWIPNFVMATLIFVPETQQAERDCEGSMQTDFPFILGIRRFMNPQTSAHSPGTPLGTHNGEVSVTSPDLTLTNLLRHDHRGLRRLGAPRGIRMGVNSYWTGCVTSSTTRSHGAGRIQWFNEQQRACQPCAQLLFSCF